MSKNMLSLGVSEQSKMKQIVKDAEEEIEKRNSEAYYFRGKWFSNATEGLEWFAEWQELPATIEDFNRRFDDVKAALWHNLKVNRRELTNCELGDLVSKLIHFFIHNLPEKRPKQNQKEKNVRSKRVEKSIRVFQQTFINT